MQSDLPVEEEVFSFLEGKELVEFPRLCFSIDIFNIKAVNYHSESVTLGKLSFGVCLNGRIM